MAIRFFSDVTNFNCKNKRIIKNWLKQIASIEKKRTGNLNIIFVSDEIITDINRNFLKHDYCTDIITFDDSSNKVINGELYISIDTVLMNAKLYEVDFIEELHRVMAHGILHLCGHKDETDENRKKMTELETKYLNLKYDL